MNQITKKKALSKLIELRQALDAYEKDVGLDHLSEVERAVFSFMMNNADFVNHESRCLYENDEAMVTHAVMSFPDGTREAVLAYNQIKDGKVIRLETGATLLP